MLTLVRRTENRRALYLCHCGTTSEKRMDHVSSGATTSCGCVGTKIRADGLRKTHGKSNSAEYRLFSTMVQRCEDVNHPSYARYGGRGIRVASEWRNDFQKFVADMGPKPSPNHSLERINNDGNYEPG